MVSSRRLAADGLPSLVGAPLAVVASDLARANLRARELEQFGYVVHAVDAGAPLEAEPCRWDALAGVVIDGNGGPALPQSLAEAIRQRTEAPILVVGSSGTLEEMAACIEAGADDYCRPGASAAEIDLRLRAIARRAARLATARPSGERIQLGDLEIDFGTQTVRKRGKEIPLSPTEFRLLATLAERAGHVVPARALVARVWGTQYADETHYLRLYIRYLRQKLEDDPSHPRYIVNRWGAGYALEVPPRAA
jgi:DNA-binding response OmpR family regulator